MPCPIDVDKLIGQYTDPASPDGLQEESFEHLKDYLKEAASVESARVVFESTLLRIHSTDIQVCPIIWGACSRVLGETEDVVSGG